MLLETHFLVTTRRASEGKRIKIGRNGCFSRGSVYEFVCISFRTDNLNCFWAS